MEEGISSMKVKFGGLDFELEGTQSFVKECLDFIESKVLPLLSTVPQATLAAQEEAAVKGVSQEPLATAPVVSLFDLYKEKKPQGHDETVMVFAFYVKTYKGLNEFSPSDIEECYKQIGARKPARVRQIMLNVKNNKGWLTPSAKKGYYRLTNIGENLVAHDLPRESGTELKK